MQRFNTPNFPVFRFQGQCELPRPCINEAIPTGEAHPDVIPYVQNASSPGYLMVWTPFPGGPTADETEYPCIARSEDKIHWAALEGTKTPLVNQWSGTFNADPDLLFVKGHYYLYYQTRLNGLWSVFSNRSKDLSFSSRVAPAFPEGRYSRSPSVLYDQENDRFIMYFDEKDKKTGYFRVMRAESEDGITFEPDTVRPCLNLPPRTSVWHPAVRYYHGYFYMVAPLYHGPKLKGGPWLGDLYFWRSQNGIDWSPGKKIIDYLDLPCEKGYFPLTAYRCAMVFETRTVSLWVSYFISQSAPTFAWASDFRCRIALYQSDDFDDGNLESDFDQGGKIILKRRFPVVSHGQWYTIGPNEARPIAFMERDDDWESATTIYWGNASEQGLLFYSAATQKLLLYRVDSAGNMQLLWENREWGKTKWRQIIPLGVNAASYIMFYSEDGMLRCSQADDTGLRLIWETHVEGNWRIVPIHCSNWLFFYDSSQGKGALYNIDNYGLSLSWEINECGVDLEIIACRVIIPYLLFFNRVTGDIRACVVTKDGLRCCLKRHMRLFRKEWTIIPVNLEGGNAEQLLFYNPVKGSVALYVLRQDSFTRIWKSDGWRKNCRIVLPWNTSGRTELLFLYA